ncbi:MAG: polysaccharide lyase [Tepidisphaeraceae bacterium]
MKIRSIVTLSAALLASASTFLSSVARAQYPHISSEIAQASNSKKAKADARSDELFQKQLPQIEADAKNGKPYLPGAGKPSDLPQADIPAFPGAEGGGMYSFGGRGGTVYVVTSIEDSGPGTFREACEAAGPRVVVFNVAGIIKLDDRIRIRAPYITIAGNSAPGDGVCIAGNTVELETHDVIIRHMRFRRGATDVGDRNDSIGGNPTGNVIIDHVSASWGLDENMSMYRHMYSPPDGGKDIKLPTVNITIQNSIFSEGLNLYNHAFGSTIGGLNSTFHKNLWACNSGRNPSVGMYGDFTFVNNVLFNWVHRSVDGGDHKSEFNIINNYLKPGPATPADKPIAWRLLKPESERSKTVVDNFGKAYVAGNLVEGNEKVTKDNWAGGVQPDSRAAVETVLPRIKMSKPYPHATLTILPTAEAYEHVLANAGATLPKRDPVDERVINSVRTGKVTAKPSADIAEKLSGVRFSREVIDKITDMVPLGIITSPADVGGYPQYQGEPHKDADKDGMPDDWESKHGLNPADASDAAKDLSGDGYSNIEKFLYGIDPSKKTDWTDPKNNLDPLMQGGKLKAASSGV